MFRDTDRRFGYARVSSKSQEENSSLQSQISELKKLGIPEENIRTEVGSAAEKISERPVFKELIDEVLKKKDFLVVTKIDRCSRNTLEFLKLQKKLSEKGIQFIALDLPYSNDEAANRLISTTLVAIATFENERRKQRQKEGIEAARKAGKYTGRKTVITPKLIQKVKMLKEKNLPIAEIVKVTGRGKNTIYKILKQELNYVPYNRLVKSPNKDEEEFIQ